MIFYCEEAWKGFHARISVGQIHEIADSENTKNSRHINCSLRALCTIDHADSAMYTNHGAMTDRRARPWTPPSCQLF